ncbi:glucokinase regulatory protein [Chanos chanos]|uniref:Glucokinase regulatory protein n=1 Tax=Chanos chanos TaxID=29144 RepID=A0A6J2VU51_CHACN|nr:glucokinase regulatory protein [Chanos chanos]
MLEAPKTEMRQWELSSFEPSLPVTEKSNPITRDIDRANTEQIVHMLEECDKELFEEGWHTDSVYKRLKNPSVIQTMVDLAKNVESILKEPNSLIIMSGCGTSGRIAFLLATSFNSMLKDLQQKEICSYIIAGGDMALLTSQEAPEDSPILGADILDKAREGKKHVLFIGISCGLSAPFVAGQLDFCLNCDVFTPVLIGFNPVHMARAEPIRDWPLNFKRVAEKMMEKQDSQKAFILNPAVGPEAISGSSRMKGGSATKMLLETVLWAGLNAAYNRREITPAAMLAQIKMYERAHEFTYSQREKIAVLVEKAGLSLKGKGHVYYVGWKTLGIIGIIDASECVPTFGAGSEDIRGFIYNGFQEMKNEEGDLSSMGSQFRIDHRDFVNVILPTLSKHDTVIFLFTVNDDLNEVKELASQVKGKTSNLHALTHDCVGNSVPNQQWEISTKWSLNAISTGAHILKGKVYRNYMIDLKVTNSKLYRRAIHILQCFTSCSMVQCETALLKAVYDVEELTTEIISADVSKHTEVANTRDRVIPTALVMLQCGCSVKEARSRLNNYSVVRDAVDSLLSVK